MAELLEWIPRFIDAPVRYSSEKQEDGTSEARQVGNISEFIKSMRGVMAAFSGVPELGTTSSYRRKPFILQWFMAEGEGFEPPVGLPQRLISSQVPLTTQPPFRPFGR